MPGMRGGPSRLVVQVEAPRARRWKQSGAGVLLVGQGDVELDTDFWTRVVSCSRYAGVVWIRLICGRGTRRAEVATVHHARSGSVSPGVVVRDGLDHNDPPYVCALCAPFAAAHHDLHPGLRISSDRAMGRVGGRIRDIFSIIVDQKVHKASLFGFPRRVC